MPHRMCCVDMGFSIFVNVSENISFLVSLYFLCLSDLVFVWWVSMFECLGFTVQILSHVPIVPRSFKR